MRRISIFGATGSIGQSTIDLIRRDKDQYDVVALTGGANMAQLAADAVEFNAEVAVTAFDDKLPELRDALRNSGVEAASGTRALEEAASRPVDWLMSAIVGAAGLKPGLIALEQGATLALANKESLVTAGPLLMQAAQQHGAKIIPVDSEHSAVFQALNGEDISTVERVILTASGGAFRDWTLEQMAQATAKQAMQHPNWSMGARITIDSASMFNKALEVLEAKEFFDLKPEQVEVLVHPESLVHALVGFCDGGMMAHVGAPDMRHAIGYALNWPKRRPLPVPMLDLATQGQLSFYAPNLTNYPALRLAQSVMKRGGLSGAVFNAAKERALDHFMAGRIGFCDMSANVEAVLEGITGSSSLIDAEVTLDNVQHIDRIARESVDARVFNSDAQQKVLRG
ncbi:1-deoxy-D-xylulose 5-phosphate reductoisomerase [Roseovarius albus]|uniref:1-deoxy-D-xylulose 5-phosphate reductoisomerase n=1 Tax=Roseovarius albus TaxID=1247867 RepID=A0A1X6YYZ4_9RHOB|nr:1-deoxy-D-xylulose-5-phosphate reductoisomerase [Roseovarius albus]SLN35501.1 1-deoxy-D-xylulose 5-phosphate reductoisomerase [Roseovarius albus]